jgi:alpha-L-fucosidase
MKSPFLAKPISETIAPPNSAFASCRIVCIQTRALETSRISGRRSLRFGSGLVVIALSFAALCLPVTAAKNKKNTEDNAAWYAKHKAPEEAVQEWKDLGLEIFVHWSAGTVFQGRYAPESDREAGRPPKEFQRDLWGEWIKGRAGIPQETYDAALKSWKPRDFDAGEWADILKNSGAKLVVYIAKHHDGFAHFQSKANNFNTHDWGEFHTDVFGELCKALHKRGVKTGFYYSHGKDWRHNTKTAKDHITPEERAYFDKIVFTHLRELTSNYGPQEVAWFDLGAKSELARKCVEIVREANPDIMISSRVGSRMGDFSTGGDAYVPFVPEKVKPWETCMTFSYHWAWYPEDRNYKTPTEVIRMLARIRSKGGNLLLNVGPDVRGRITFQEKNCLEKLGAWLKTNGDSIYAARATPYTGDQPWGVCTTKPGKLFLHLLKLPGVDSIFVPGIKSKIKSAYILADKSKTPLKTTPGEFGLKVDLYQSDSKFIDYRDTVVVLEFDGAPDIDTVPVLDNDLDNRFIPLLAENTKPVKTSTNSRLTPVIDHGGVQEPRYYAYSFGYSKPDARSTWKFRASEDNFFYLNIKYANFTGAPVKAVATVDGVPHTVELPPTPEDPMKSKDCFATILVPMPVPIRKGAEHTLSFEVAEDSRNPALDKSVGKRLKASFMLEAITLKPAYPPAYQGYGDNPNMTKIHPAEESKKK